jgi:hypothetical protein
VKRALSSFSLLQTTVYQTGPWRRPSIRKGARCNRVAAAASPSPAGEVKRLVAIAEKRAAAAKSSHVN